MLHLYLNFGGIISDVNMSSLDGSPLHDWLILPSRLQSCKGQNFHDKKGIQMHAKTEIENFYFARDLTTLIRFDFHSEKEIYKG